VIVEFGLGVGLQVYSFDLVEPFVVGGHHDLPTHLPNLAQLFKFNHLVVGYLVTKHLESAVDR
jgi:hypothetical protein